MSLWLVLLAQWLMLAVLMTGAWATERRTGNSGYIDAIWSFSVGLTGAAFALLPLSADSLFGRQLMMAAMSAAWGIRLGLHIIARSRLKHDDPRYAAMKQQWGQNAGREMFSLLQKQAIVAVPLVFAVYLAAHNPSPNLSAQDALAVCIFLIAIMGEAIADNQLRSFVAQPANRGYICDVGLWRYSRHPNYFFEWLHWVAYPLAAISLGGDWYVGWLAALAPLTMYWLLVHVSGVPPLEQHMLAKHGDRFRAYQARTNAFFPGPVKNV